MTRSESGSRRIVWLHWTAAQTKFTLFDEERREEGSGLWTVAAKPRWPPQVLLINWTVICPEADITGLQDEELHLQGTGQVPVDRRRKTRVPNIWMRFDLAPPS